MNTETEYLRSLTEEVPLPVGNDRDGLVPYRHLAAEAADQ